jgi:hypothetical protein
MARFFSISSGAGALSFLALSVATLQAQPSMVPPPEPVPPEPMTTTPPPPKPVVSPSVAQVKPTPPSPAKPDTFNKYGKIWAPSDDVDHPLKLNGHFPGVAEIRIPSQDELNDRDKLEQLSMLSDTEIRAQLEQWAPYSKMKLGDQGQLLMRIQQFKEQRTKIAMDKAHALGIYDSLTPGQREHFEQAYWDKRRQMDHDEVKQMEPIVKTWNQKLDEDLFRKFSSASAGPIVPAPVSQPPQAPSAPVATDAAAMHPLAQSPR